MARKKSSSKPQKSKPVDTFLKYTGLGFSMMLSIGILGYLGYRLDLWLHSTPLFILLGILLGLVGNIYILLKSSSHD